MFVVIPKSKMPTKNNNNNKKPPTAVKKPTTTTNKKPPTTPRTAKDKKRSPRTAATRTATRNKPKRATKRGGELLGQGVYGCAFSPRIPCSPNYPSKLKGAVSKLMTAHAAKEESVNANLTSRMDPEGQYFLPFVGICHTDRNTVTKYIHQYPEDETCTSLNTVLSKEPHLLVYKHKGIDLEKYLEKGVLMPLEDMVKHLLNVAKGIQLLQKNYQYAHTDIKPDNVLLVDLENGEKRMLLMDFGLLEDLDSIYENENKLQHNSEHYPPELLVYYVLHWEINVKEDQLYDWLFSDHASYQSGNFLHYGNRNKIWIKSIDKYQEKLKAFFTQLYKFMNADNGNDKEKAKNLQKHFTENFAKKMDVFQFGFVLHKVMTVYDFVDDVMYTPEEGDKDRFKDLKNIVENTYHPNPYARCPIDKVIKELEKMVNKSYSTTVVTKKQLKSTSPPASTKNPQPSPFPMKAATTPKALEKKKESGVIARYINKGKALFMNNNSLKMLQRYINTDKKRKPQTAGNKGVKTVVGSKKATTTKRTPTASARSGTTKKK